MSITRPKGTTCHPSLERLAEAPERSPTVMAGDAPVFASAEHVSCALDPYCPEYHSVKSSKTPQGRECSMQVVLDSYPFTKDEMPYASINLINLAVEQALLVHFFFYVVQEEVEGPWASVADYQELVKRGHWLVPKLHTSVFRPVPLRTEVDVRSQFHHIRSGNIRCTLSFSVTSDGFFSAEGVAVLDPVIPIIEFAGGREA